MTWSDFYLICFLVGFGLSALALLAGSVHLHLPHLHLHHGIHLPHAHAGGVARGGRAICRGSISAPSPRSWPGSAARAICWSATTTCGFVLALGVATLSGMGAAARGVLVPGQGA